MENRAGFWIRFVAYFIDGIIVGVIQGIFTLIFGRSGTGAVINSIISILIFLVYYIWIQSRNGQTLGKKLMGIQVIKVDGRPVTVVTLLLREIIGKAISALIIFIGFLMAAGPKKRALHDYMAGTVVVRTE